MLVQSAMPVQNAARRRLHTLYAAQIVGDNRVAVDVEKTSAHILGDRSFDKARAVDIRHIIGKINADNLACIFFEGSSLVLFVKRSVRLVVNEHDNLRSRHFFSERISRHESLLVIQILRRGSEHIHIFHRIFLVPAEQVAREDFFFYIGKVFGVAVCDNHIPFLFEFSQIFRDF